ncbi:MAG: hypothetical protein WC656_07960 [Sulfurimonas sp.]|jgi:hypothetical protein
MKNFLNVRIQSCNNNDIKTRIKHNLRSVKCINTDTTKILEDRDIIFIDTNLKNNRINIINETNKTESKRLASIYATVYKEDRTQHAKLYKENNPQNLRDTHSTWFEAVMTFSEAIDSDLGTKYSREDLIQCAKNNIADMAKAMNTEAVMLVLHLDEIRPHFHVLFKNFGDKGQSIFFENRTRDKLSALQDLIHDNFKTLGMQRGIRKAPQDCGIYDYQKTSTFKAKQIYEQQEQIRLAQKIASESLLHQARATIASRDEQQAIIQEMSATYSEEKQKLKELKKEIKNDINRIRELKNYFKNLQVDIKEKIETLKQERASLTQEVTISIQDKKELYKNISTSQETLRSLNQSIKDFSKMDPAKISDLVIQNLVRELQSNKIMYEQDMEEKSHKIIELERIMNVHAMKGL